MERPLESFEKVTDVVDLYAGAQLAEITCPHGEARRLRWRRRGCEALPQDFVDDVLERSPTAPGSRTQLGRHIVIEGQCRPHIMMLKARHHDVNPLAGPTTT